MWAEKSIFIEIMKLDAAVILHVKHNYKYKHLLLKAPLCSKAALLLKEKGWKVYNDIV